MSGPAFIKFHNKRNWHIVNPKIPGHYQAMCGLNGPRKFTAGVKAVNRNLTPEKCEAVGKPIRVCHDCLYKGEYGLFVRTFIGKYLKPCKR